MGFINNNTCAGHHCPYPLNVGAEEEECVSHTHTQLLPNIPLPTSSHVSLICIPVLCLFFFINLRL